MQSPRLQAITARLNPHNLRTSFRRRSSSSSTASSRTSGRRSPGVSSAKRDSFYSASSRHSHASSSGSAGGSPVSTINSIIFRQPSIVGMEEERKSFGSELNILEPRPLVYWEGLEERMGSF